MRVVVVTPPEPVVSLDQAKRHLRVDHGDEDALIASLVEVATAWLDAPGGWLGQALGLQTLRATLDANAWAQARRLPYPPLVDIQSEVPSADGRTVSVTYAAGYPFVGEGQDRKSLVPAPIRHAILLMVGHLYSNRDAVTTTAAQPAQMPLGVDALLGPYRVWI